VKSWKWPRMLIGLISVVIAGRVLQVILRHAPDSPFRSRFL